MKRKADILNAATESFARFGYKGTTVEQVAKIANVGKGTVYLFFENKKELLREAVLNLIQEMKIEADKTLNPNEDFMKNAHNGLIKMLQYREQHMLFAKLIEEEARHSTPEVTSNLVEIENEILQYVETRIQSGIEKNVIHECEPKHIAFLLLKAYKAVVVDWQETFKEPLAEQDILQLFNMTIFKGLAK